MRAHWKMGPELSKFDFEKWAFLRQVESSMKTGEGKKVTMNISII